MVAFCHVSSRVEGEKYPGLLRASGGSGFPLLAFLDAKGDVVARMPATGRTVVAFERTHARLTELAELRARAAAGDPRARVEALIAALELGQIKNHVIAEGRVAELPKRTPDQDRRIARALADLEVPYVRRRRWKASRRGKHVARMFERGRIPNDVGNARYYWGVLMKHFSAQEDAGGLARALEVAKRSADRRTQQLVERYEDRLARLRKD